MGPEAPEFVLNELGVDVCGKTLGIVGMGGIGMRLAKRACAFEMPILYHNRKRRCAHVHVCACVCLCVCVWCMCS